jgi:hypothetical protein
MTVHLIKLAVGADSIEDLSAWQDEHLRHLQASGAPARLVHTTRMTPKRVDEIVNGGSLYWVIKGKVQARQRLLAIEPFKDAEGIGRCHLVLDHALVRVKPRRKRPFQGWRYLEPKDAPADLPGGALDAPEELRKALADLGLL